MCWVHVVFEKSTVVEIIRQVYYISWHSLNLTIFGQRHIGATKSGPNPVAEVCIDLFGLHKSK